MPSTRHATALRFLSGFTTLSTELLVTSTRTPDCVHVFAPGSVPIPPKTNDAFAAHVAGLRGVIKGFSVTPKEVMEDEKLNRVVVWATARPEFYKEVMDGGAEDWDYQGEYVFIFSMDQSGEKIERIVEFLDSKGTERLRGLMGKARANKERSEGAGK